MTHLHITVQLGLLLSMSSGTSWSPTTAEDLLFHIDRNGQQTVALGAYELVTDMASYRSVDDRTPFEQARSTMIVSGNDYRVEALGLITIQDGDKAITVDSVEQTILILPSGPAIDKSSAERMRLVIEKAARIEKKLDGSSITFKVDLLEGAYYSHVFIKFDGEGWLTYMESHWRSEIEEDPGDPDSAWYRPKVVFQFSRPRQLQESYAQAKLDTDQFVHFKNDIPETVQVYAAYEIHDSRIRR